MEGALTTPYNGLWYDYATNTRILTLSGAKASTLQAALPIAITFVGAQVWSIIRLILYHLHYRRKPNTSSAQIGDLKGYLEQRRVLLRNSWGGVVDCLCFSNLFRKCVTGAASFVNTYLEIAVAELRHH